MKTDVYEEKPLTATKSPGDQEKSGSAHPNVEKEEIVKKLQAAGTPGPGHKALDAFAGEWKNEVKCLEPGGPVNVSHATSKARWILGGRFLEEEFHGEMMGKPFTGKCLLGFDNTKQKFKSVWVDDLGTAMLTSEGTGENGNNTIVLEGKADCPASGQKDISMKQVLRVISPNKHILEMFHDGEKRMEITYTRR
ncbi:MAG: DUF1579 domain-containing protein [Verrucomicrobiota bacterium]|jgi:hypothetical protein